MIGSYDILEDIVRNSFWSVVWSHKIQEKQSDIYAYEYKRMETIKIVAASLSSIGIITLIFTDPLWLKLISALISFATIFISAYFKSFDLQKLVILHKASANKLIAVRDQFIILLAEIKLQNDSVENLFIKYKELVKRLDAIYLEAPSTTDKAVEMACNSLQVKKDNTAMSDEIDSFLPLSLRKEKTNE